MLQSMMETNLCGKFVYRQLRIRTMNQQERNDPPHGVSSCTPGHSPLHHPQPLRLPQSPSCTPHPGPDPPSGQFVGLSSNRNKHCQTFQNYITSFLPYLYDNYSQYLVELSHSLGRCVNPSDKLCNIFLYCCKALYLGGGWYSGGGLVG